MPNGCSSAVLAIKPYKARGRMLFLETPQNDVIMHSMIQELLSSNQ